MVMLIPTTSSNRDDRDTNIIFALCLAVHSILPCPRT